MRQTSRAGIPPDCCVRLAEKLALVAFRQCFTRVFSPQLIRNVRSRRRIDSSSIIAHPVNLRWERSLMPRTRHIYVYDALDNRYGFSISVQPEIDCTTFHSFFPWNVWKKKVFQDFQKLAGLWLVGEMDNHVGIYGSKVAEGFSAFQRRSCSIFCWI